MGTPAYLKAYVNQSDQSGKVVAMEYDLYWQRLRGTEASKKTVLPLLCEGEPRDALPPLLQARDYSDFRNHDDYFARVFDLVLHLYRVEHDDPAVLDLREALANVAVASIPS